jgi:hypothetical protein
MCCSGRLKDQQVIFEAALNGSLPLRAFRELIADDAIASSRSFPALLDFSRYPLSRLLACLEHDRPRVNEAPSGNLARFAIFCMLLLLIFTLTPRHVSRDATQPFLLTVLHTSLSSLCV